MQQHDPPEWWINMKRNQAHFADVTNVESKRIQVEEILGGSSSRLVAEYCELIKCESKSCDRQCLWGML